MISKVAIQAGLGVTSVGGVAGVIAWQLIPESEKITSEYLVEVPTTQTDVTAENNLQEKSENQEKNYFCQWGETNNAIKDNDCVIKQIKFDTTSKKASLLSEITKKDNSSAFETSITKDTIKAVNTWFLLKITGYNFNLETDQNIPNIDIFSTTNKDNSTTEFKKYSTVTPKFKIEKQKATQGKTSTFLVQLNGKTNAETITGTAFKCKWISHAEAVEHGKNWSTAIEDNGNKLKNCSIYKFTSQPAAAGTEPNKKVNELNLTNINSTAITISSAATDIKGVADNSYFIISFTAADNADGKSVAELSDLVMLVAVDGINKPIATFKTESPITGKVDTTTFTDSKLILLN